MSKNKKFAFIKMGSFSHTNDKLLAALKEKFSDYEVDIIDVNNLIRRRDPLCLIIAFMEYGLKIVTGKKELMKCRSRTVYFMNKARTEIIKKLKESKYDFTFQTQSLFDASLIGVPHFIYTDHTHLVNLTYPSFKAEQLYSSKWTECERSIYTNATINFSMSTHVSKSIVEQYGVDDKSVILARCGSHLVTPTNIDELECRYSSKNILFVGLDWIRKGGPQLIEAFEQVLIAHPDASLTIVGCKPKIELQNVNVIGMIPLEEVDKYYLKSSIFCLPTRREPFGIVFLEAFANKLPIVSTMIGALPDIVAQGQSGYLVDYDDVDMLAKKLIHLLDNPTLCKEFGHVGYGKFVANYTWEKTADIMHSHIQNILNIG